jgi:cytochrome oxidase Cu insertion factor (SCO1/SenC/PrrC family)
MHRYSPIAAVALATVLAVSAAAASSIAAAPKPLPPPGVGQPAPDFTLVDQNGKAVSLSAARGHKVVLVFYRGYW